MSYSRGQAGSQEPNSGVEVARLSDINFFASGTPLSNRSRRDIESENADCEHQSRTCSSLSHRFELVGRFSYTSRVSFSQESLLHSPCRFQWAALGTLVFNHACMPDLSFSQRHQTIDVVECHVGWQKSYSALIIDAEKESKSPEKRDNDKVCAVTARHPLHTQLHTTPSLLVPTWQAWAYRRAVSKYNTPQKNSWAVQCYLPNLTIQALVGSLSYTSKLVLWEVSITRPRLLVVEGFSYTSRASFS